MTAALYPVPDHFWAHNADAKQAAADRASARGLEPCVVCGRGVQPGKAWAVEIVDGGAHIAHPGLGTDQNDPGYLGVWVIGPECSKGIPREFRRKWADAQPK